MAVATYGDVDFADEKNKFQSTQQFMAAATYTQQQGIVTALPFQSMFGSAC
jgi:hypothetical protein